MSNHRSEEARQLQNERRVADRERTDSRHAARAGKYQPTRGIAGAW